MTDSEGSDGGTRSSAPAAPRKRRRTASRKPAARPRKTVARKKPAARRRRTSARRASASGGGVDAFLQALSSRASETGAGIAALSEEGAVAARRAAGRISKASRQAIDRLTREWKALDSGRRIQVLSALLGALAAASAPIVRGRLKKK